jgi:hypothetical protein
MASSTLRLPDPIMVFPKIERLLPKRENERKETADPQFMKLRTDAVLPSRAKERTEVLEPNVKKIENRECAAEAKLRKH